MAHIYRPKHHVRFVTASSLFDGHDAAINIMRRILQASGAEVIHESVVRSRWAISPQYVMSGNVPTFFFGRRSSIK